MRNFSLVRAKSAADAVAAITDDAAFHAGGTELLNWMRLGIAEPGLLVDLGGVEGLGGIVRDGDTLRIGARATLNEIGESDEVRLNAPVLSQACLKAASPQIRNRATIAGNILQKTRCPWFRAEAPGETAMPWPCNKRAPGSGCAARDSGFSRLALYGATEACAATQPSDPVVALSSLDAIVEVVGKDGVRLIPITEFHLAQSEARDAVTETTLRRGELVTSFHIPLDVAARGSAYVKVRERESYEYAMVSCAVALQLDGESVGAVRISLGSVAQKPWRLRDAEQALSGARLSREAVDAAVVRDLGEARPLPGNEFKPALVGNAVRRALQMAGGKI